MLIAPLLIMMFAPGFIRQGEQFELAVQMLRITLPYLFFIGSTAFAGGILNTYGRFAVPALTPALLNLCMIAAALWLAPLMPQPVVALAWGVFTAGIAQLAFQFPALLRLGLLPRLRRGFNDPGVKRIMSMMLPAIFGVSVTQINLLLDTLIASLLDTGSVSWLYYSDRLVEFPLGVCGVALATVILPALSKDHAAGDAQAFSQALDWGLRLIVLFGLPATLGLILLARPLTLTLYGYDAFSAHDVAMAARSLTAYAGGLLGFMLIKVLAPGFAARQDMRTPVRYGLYALLAHLALGIGLAFPLAHAGLALATSLAAFFNAALLGVKLFNDRAYRPSRYWLGFAWRVLLACGAMVIALRYGAGGEDWEHWDAQQRAWQLGLRIGAAMVIYLMALLLCGYKFRDIAANEAHTE
jgi:putative peptidoglycan lipid II flippase